jgi:hypothetical protein
VLRAVALALSGRAGARLPGHLACMVSRSTLVHLARAAADPDEAIPLVLGVDDFALRKGHVYAPSWSTSRPAGRWTCCPERSANSLRAWLDAYRVRRSSAGTAADAARPAGFSQPINR